MPSRLFQYKVTIPEVGETVIYASSPAELAQKMRLLINPRYRGDVKIERIMPGEAGKFFMDKRMKHMRNVKEQARSANEAADGTAEDCHREEKDYDEEAGTSEAVATEDPTVEEASKSWRRTRCD